MIYPYWVYIITNRNNTTLYTGVTNNLFVRTWEHKTKRDAGSFSAKYNLNKLVYYEGFQSIEDAIKREKFIKGKSRQWKLNLIGSGNPHWKDLTDSMPM